MQAVEYWLKWEPGVDGPFFPLLHSTRYALLDALMRPGAVEG